MYNQKDNLPIWKTYIHTIPMQITRYNYDKYYVGITSKDNPNDRWKDGWGYYNQIFFAAIKKYGWENIKHEVVSTGLTLPEALAEEKELIKKYDSLLGHRGYNESPGGEYIPRTNEPIVIFEKKIVVPSIYHCAEITNESINHIKYMIGKEWDINNQTDAWKYHYCMLKHLYKYTSSRRQSSSKPVVYLRTGELFPSLHSACKITGIHRKSSYVIGLEKYLELIDTNKFYLNQYMNAYDYLKLFDSVALYDLNAIYS